MSLVVMQLQQDLQCAHYVLLDPTKQIMGQPRVKLVAEVLMLVSVVAVVVYVVLQVVLSIPMVHPHVFNVQRDSMLQAQVTPSVIAVLPVIIVRKLVVISVPHVLQALIL